MDPMEQQKMLAQALRAQQMPQDLPPVKPAELIQPEAPMQAPQPMGPGPSQPAPEDVERMLADQWGILEGQKGELRRAFEGEPHQPASLVQTRAGMHDAQEMLARALNHQAPAYAKR